MSSEDSDEISLGPSEDNDKIPIMSDFDDSGEIQLISINSEGEWTIINPDLEEFIYEQRQGLISAKANTISDNQPIISSNDTNLSSANAYLGLRTLTNQTESLSLKSGCSPKKVFRVASAECEKLCPMKHPCILPAHDGPCPPCHVNMLVTHECCQKQTRVLCCQVGTSLDMCGTLNRKELTCGHFNLVKCSEPHSASAEVCKNLCNQLLDKEYGGCGHLCQGKCVDCLEGRVHVRCSEPCGKNLMCGHVCNAPCPKFCPPCTKPCAKACDHGKCRNICGAPCPPCEETCTWNCVHKICSNKCFELCNRTPCNEPCPQLLTCGHECIGFCGEKCPPICRVCNKKELIPGLLLLKNEVDQNDRFVFLQECGHTVEVSVLTQWLETEPDNNEIIAKSCPICKTRIFNCPRFGNILKLNEKEISRVKEFIVGSRDELDGILRDCFKTIHKIKEDSMPFRKFHAFLSNYLLHLFEITRQQRPVTKLVDKADMNTIIFETNLLKIALKDHKRAVERYETENIGKLEISYTDLMEILMVRQLPFHPNEIHDFGLEINRISSLVKLLDRCAKTTSDTIKNLRKKPRCVQAFARARDIVLENKKFDSKRLTEFNTALALLDKELKYSLGISDREKFEILDALDLTMGRWFKCPNDHIYVVTECGGVVEVATCNECGARIGGQNHRLMPTNALATEMDGAVEPLYTNTIPEELDAVEVEIEEVEEADPFGDEDDLEDEFDFQHLPLPFFRNFRQFK